MRTAPEITLSQLDRETVGKWARGRSTQVSLMQRAQIMPVAAEGMTDKDIAARLGMNRVPVGRWRSRFAECGLSGIEKDSPLGGRKPTQRNRSAPEILRRTIGTDPDNATHWSTRTLARELDVTQSMATRVWRANGLTPYLTETFKLGNDPGFIGKVTNIVGLYLDPPEHALVLCAGKKSQIQALDRTQPGLPMKKGRCGTTTLFAALDAAEGRRTGTCMPRHRHQEWIKFLKVIGEQTAGHLDPRLIVDNYATHKHPGVKAWLKRYPRFHMRFTPACSSWLNLVERLFGELTDKRIRCGVFRSLNAPIKAISAFIDARNDNPQSYIWTAPVLRILDKVQQERKTFDKVQPT